MRVDDIRLQFAHHGWALDRLLTAMNGLSGAELVEPAGAGHAPIRDTFVHTARTFGSWRFRARGMPAPPRVPESEYATVAALRAMWETERDAYSGYLNGLSDADLDERVSWSSRSMRTVSMGTRWHLLIHPLTHAAQHRAEIAQALTLLGRSPGDLDLIVYLHERGLLG